ncbi:trypsin-like serine peptidase [Erythrobacter mangrovi]|uniref:Trypsin-like peptidase domain-containing protein n=1 Tax=Erythrobacter mangrovi TaxID=2739433 RepID=A0A7D4BC32_9SPHN|nr:serine protease [Erythrobacter mangrovi]QKG72426.1 trypsin-like peptidase domain-containing protein [Erythrobacter mangrovi]
MPAAIRIAEPDLDPARAIGRIVCQQAKHRFVSTAVLVRDTRTLLAAGHFNSDDLAARHLPISSCRFEHRSASGTRFASAFTLVETGGGPMERRLTPATDWAVLRLAEPAPRFMQPVTRISDPEEAVASPLEMAAYDDPGRYGSAVSLEACKGWRGDARSVVMRHSCRTRPGQSGSPIFRADRSELELTAIHVGAGETAGRAVLLAKSLRRALLST